MKRKDVYVHKDQKHLFLQQNCSPDKIKLFSVYLNYIFIGYELKWGYCLDVFEGGDASFKRIENLKLCHFSPMGPVL